jgi:fructose transport system substrate-binding protein
VRRAEPLVEKRMTLMQHVATHLPLLLAALLSACAATPPADQPTNAPQPVVGLITKTASNPYFAKMRDGAEAAAKAHGARLIMAAGRSDNDSATQAKAIDDMLASGARTILITPADGRAIVPAVRKAQAAGAMVIALDNPTEPVDTTDALIASNNYRMGVLAGQYAKAAMAGKAAVIATLDLFPGHPLGVQRHNGFLSGFGLSANDASSNQQSTNPAIVCSSDTFGDRARGHAAMEDCLRKHPDINLVYTMNEAVAAGATQALRDAGKAGSALLVSFDGSCRGIDDVRAGAITAVVAQFPQQMASLGVEAGVAYARTGRKPAGYVESPVALVTAKPIAGVESRDVSNGASLCWGR